MGEPPGGHARFLLEKQKMLRHRGDSLHEDLLFPIP
jgi:hypothetical protein